MQFEKAVQALRDAEVDFVVIGGLSATLHGSAQATYDLDICYSRASANLRRLIEALAPFHRRPRGFPAGLPFLGDETTLQNGTVFTLETDIGEIDLLAEVRADWCKTGHAPAEGSEHTRRVGEPTRSGRAITQHAGVHAPEVEKL